MMNMWNTEDHSLYKISQMIFFFLIFIKGLTHSFKFKATAHYGVSVDFKVRLLNYIYVFNDDVYI